VVMIYEVIKSYLLGWSSWYLFIAYSTLKWGD